MQKRNNKLLLLNIKKSAQIIFVLFFCLNTFSQAKFLSGYVLDANNKPLERANIIAKPTLANQTIKFVIADNKGYFNLEIVKNITYIVSVSYIGFKEQLLTIEPNNDLKNYNFILEKKGDQLKEIIIKNNVKPIVIKQDTLIFNVSSFANGNERKLKEILKKLPGIEVDKKGSVTVQGKRVTQLLVEGKRFFGGGSKLAVENIPADALEKIEVIDHFNQVGFMKKVSDSEELAMNIKLKVSKKKFVFGDIALGAEVANDSGFYTAHSSLFYYSPKTNISFIGDSNNTGKSTFTFDDLFRFDSGNSSYLNNRKPLSNLNSLVDDNVDFEQSKSNFSAVNFSVDVTEKLSISGFGIFSKLFSISALENKNTFFQNEFTSFENRNEQQINTLLLGICNLKIDYSVNKNEKLFYNIQYQANKNRAITSLNSQTNTDENQFETTTKAVEYSVKQYVEWHKKQNEHFTSTIVINQSFENKKPTTNWQSNKVFLVPILQFEPDSNYNIQQIKTIKSSTLDVLLKEYWILNDFNHMYFAVGNNYGNSNFFSSEKQLKTNQIATTTNQIGFGNDIDYMLNDTYLGIEYKFMTGKWIFKPGVYAHQYNLRIKQFDDQNNLQKSIIQPQFVGEYVFSKSETATLNYKFGANFKEAESYAINNTVESYNAVFKGTVLLENEQYHSLNGRYSKINLSKGVTINAIIDFNKKTRSVRNQILISGINQYKTPFWSLNPETNLRLIGSISKNIYRFNLKLNSNLSYSNFIQTLNNVATVVEKQNQNLELTLRTASNKWPSAAISYKKGFNQIQNIIFSNFTTNEINIDTDFSFIKTFTFKAEYENFQLNANSQTNNFQIANFYLSYQKKNSPLLVELSVNNLFDTKFRSSNSITDYLSSQQSTKILPRIMLLTLNYKL